jgi:hypothetical protein
VKLEAARSIVQNIISRGKELLGAGPVSRADYDEWMNGAGSIVERMFPQGDPRPDKFVDDPSPIGEGLSSLLKRKLKDLSFWRDHLEILSHDRSTAASPVVDGLRVRAKEKLGGASGKRDSDEDLGDWIRLRRSDGCELSLARIDGEDRQLYQAKILDRSARVLREPFADEIPATLMWGYSSGAVFRAVRSESTYRVNRIAADDDAIGIAHIVRRNGAVWTFTPRSGAEPCFSMHARRDDFPGLLAVARLDHDITRTRGLVTKHWPAGTMGRPELQRLLSLNRNAVDAAARRAKKRSQKTLGRSL